MLWTSLIFRIKYPDIRHLAFIPNAMENYRQNRKRGPTTTTAFALYTLVCITLLITGMRFSQHLRRELQEESTYGRILPFFDTTFNPRFSKEIQSLTTTTRTARVVMFTVGVLKTADFSPEEAYLISFSDATKINLVGRSRLNSTPFLGLPRGRLPLLILINLLAGDISLNPGPVTSNSTSEIDPCITTRNRLVHLAPEKKRRRGRKPKFPCGLCGYAAKTDCIQCSSCDAWFHENCSGISNDTMKLHADHPSLIWICPECDDMNLSNSSSNLPTSNSFDICPPLMNLK